MNSISYQYVHISMKFYIYIYSPGGASGKELTCQCGRHKTQVRSLVEEDPLAEGTETHSRGSGEAHRGALWATVHKVAKSRTRLKRLSRTHIYL